MRLEPCLAVKWERRDETTFRFELRRGVRFHNGERFDAEAVRFSLERASKHTEERLGFRGSKVYR